ncbi:MAG: hypothetical protein U0531_06110 [Dehalococcoidia bacterium]
MREGDIIGFDIPNRRLDVELTADRSGADEGLGAAAAALHHRCFRQKYAALVSSAAEGAVTLPR